MINNSPCRNCKNRKPSCHGQCVDYISWKANQFAETIDPEKKSASDFVDYQKSRNDALVRAHKTRRKLGAR